MPDELHISDKLSIPLSEIECTAIRAQGAGGQNVNKVASAVHLRFDAASCTALPQSVRERVLALSDQRVTAGGVVIIKAQKFRTLERNRREAMERLAELLRAALVVAKPRKKTRVPRNVKAKRLEGKRKHGELKQRRGRVEDS